MRHHRDDSGFALISVIIISVVIALIASTLLTLLRSVSNDSSVLASDVELRAVAEAGLNRIILAYTRPGDLLRPQLVADGRSIDWQFDDRLVTLSVQAESGKVDLNAGSRSHIGALAGRLIADDVARSRFLTRLDALRAERARITSIAELLPAFERMSHQGDLMARHLTVLTNQRGFDPRSAPPLVLETSTEIPAADQKAILDARSDGQPFTFSSVQSGAFARERPIYTLRAETVSTSGRRGAMTAIVEFSELGKISVYGWARAAVSHQAGQ